MHAVVIFYLVKTEPCNFWSLYRCCFPEGYSPSVAGNHVDWVSGNLAVHVSHLKMIYTI